jgi:hypothetical protein
MTANAHVDRSLPANYQPDGELMTVKEAIAKFHGEWVLMKVTAYDEDHWPSEGYVIAHSPERGKISKALALEPPRGSLPPDVPRLRYYPFLAYPRARSLAEYHSMSGDRE